MVGPYTGSPFSVDPRPLWLYFNTMTFLRMCVWLPLQDTM
jgi:hypothetical protein